MSDYDATLTLRLPSEEKTAIYEAAERIGLSGSEMIRTLWRMYAAENHGIFDDEYLAQLATHEAQVNEELENRMAYFESNVDDQIVDCFESAMPPEMVAKKMERRLDEIDAGYDAGIIGDDLREQYQRLVVQRTKEYEEDFAAAEQHQHENQRPTGRYSGVKHAGDFEFWVDTCAEHVLNGRVEWAKQLRDEDAMEYAPAHKTESDVWDDICDDAVEKAIDRAGPELLDGRPVRYTDLPQAADVDPLDRGLDELADSARKSVYRELLDRLADADDPATVLEETNAIPADYSIERIYDQAGISAEPDQVTTPDPSEGAETPPTRSAPNREEIDWALDIALTRGQEAALEYAEEHAGHLDVEPEDLVAEARERAYRNAVNELQDLAELSIPKLARHLGANTTEAEFGAYNQRELLAEVARREAPQFPLNKTADDALADALGVQTRATDQLATNAAIATSDGGNENPTNTDRDNEQ